MKIYTKGGDKGKTATYGGPREFKDDLRFEVLGVIDETNAMIGLLRAKIDINDNTLQEKLHNIQSIFMHSMSYFAVPGDVERKTEIKIPTNLEIESIENWIDEIEEELGDKSQYFTYPGTDELNALAHLVRTKIRTAERRIVSLSREEEVHDNLFKYFNRLSDLFFALSRFFTFKSGKEDENWKLFLSK